MENNNQIKRGMGLFTAIATMTGCVIGASVFIVPGTLSAQSGPNAWISYLIGAVLTLFSCFVYAQVGAALPASGANYQLCSSINGGFGFLYVWCYFLGYSFLFPIMARTAASYLVVMLPFLAPYSSIISITLIVLIGLFNLFGTELSGKLQDGLVVLLIVVVLVFSTGGIIHADWSNFTPLFPAGFKPVIVGVLSTYYAFAGVNCIIDMSGDIKNPGKNIPLTVFVSMGIIIVMYLGMCIALEGLLPWSELGGDAPAIVAAEKIFPSWFSGLLAAAAIAACLTTLNAVFGAMSRVLYVLGNDGILPKAFSKVSNRGVPSTSIVSLIALGSIMCLFYASLMQFVNISSFYLLLVALLVSYAFIKMPQNMPAAYNNSPFRLKGKWYYVWPILTIISSIIFMIIELISDTKFALIAICFIPVGILLYLLRSQKVKM